MPAYLSRGARQKKHNPLLQSRLAQIFGENLRPLEAWICGRGLIFLGWWVLTHKQE